MMGEGKKIMTRCPPSFWWFINRGLKANGSNFLVMQWKENAR